ncbi:phosphatidylserine decarboxylase proenzyme 3-like [Teratosphaeria destructans]|uniref:Phosphatidylserine decarboxylase proenzyme 2 n=1 Tax=Teratosphaeria destructans TaxID=418781 RepID=A0A9W7SMN6_9PEZI|nr:phosphatidylserine decarboxylase proenzyme 3-like [Teratosphaeria destructans]
MPRPHMPQHLSLHRVKSSQNHKSTNGPETPGPPSPAPSQSGSSKQLGASTTPSRNGSPTRTSGAGSTGAMPRAVGPGSPGEGRGDHRGMGLVLRVSVLKGRKLAAKDKSGTSDPYLVLTLGDAKEATSVVSKTLNPEWGQTFEFPVTDTDSALLEAVCWDKDRFKKDYMGEFDVMLEEVFARGTTTPEPKWYPLEGRRSGKRKQKKDANVSGEVLLKFQLFDPLNPVATPQQVLQKFHGVVAEVGQDEEDEEDEDLLRQVNSRDLDDVSEEDGDDETPPDEEVEGARTPGGGPDDQQKRRRRQRLKKLKRKSKLKTYEFSGLSDVAGVLFLEINRITDLPPERNLTRTSFDMDPFVVTSLGKKTYRTRTVNHNLNPVYDEKLVFQVQKHELNYSLSFAVVDKDKFSGNDFVGTALFPVEKVRSLSPEADPETGLYKLPDPDAVTDNDTRRRKWRAPMNRSNSQTNVNTQKSGRPSRNSSATNLTKLNKSASNSGLAQLGANAGVQSASTTSNQQGAPPRLGLQRQDSDSSLLMQEQVRPAPTSNTSAYSYMSANGSTHVLNEDGSDESGLYYYELPLELKNKARWEDKHNPVLYIRAKYLPYRALRQQFWRVMLRQYDADESGRIDKVELVTMLDTLGSTLHNSTIDGFFRRFQDQNGGEEILTMDQAVRCLEDQLMQNTTAHRSLDQWKGKVRDMMGVRGSDPSTSTARLGMEANGSSSEDSPSAGQTPYMGSTTQNLNPSTNQIPTLEVSDLSDAGERGERLPDDELAVTPQPSSSPPSFPPENDLTDLEDGGGSSGEEHVVEIHECPICHLPRLTRGRKTTDADIITHIATCASSDWRAVNNLMMAGFVTSSQAQRKWYSKIITKVSYGGYRLGANSANILVQDRMTGIINEERMSVYVRLGIRLLYKGLKSNNMENKKVRKLLRSMSFKQGKKYDDPASASQIPGFINFHQLDMSEVLRRTEEFKTFNEFFYRELKPGARPCSAPENPHIIVSPADCRSVVFNKLDEAQKIWVKGRDFSVERLLGDVYPQDAKRYKGGALGIFRLAPQDYHRFHVPVDGIMCEPKTIDGEYYTVNPMAIRSALDVYGENVRVIVPIDSDVHGRVMVICVGAMLVGSTVITRPKGERVRRAEELGYFKFGGSTLLVLFEPGRMVWDDDLVANSNGALETLLRVGMSVGHSEGHAPHTPDMQKANPTVEEKAEAKRRIEGSLAPSAGGDVGGGGVGLGMKIK